MKKETAIFIFLSLSLVLVSMQSEMGTRQLDASVIPDDAIRLRILANSDSEADQLIKRKVRDVVRSEISSWVENYRSIDDARTTIKEQMPEIEKLVEHEIKQAGMILPFSVTFDQVAFPTKLYGSYMYPAGLYEAVLITLGAGDGANWWCVLFPPLCFLNIDDGEAIEEERPEPVKEETEDDAEIEVSFFIVDWFTNLWSKIIGDDE